MTQIGRYDVVRELKSGGMASATLARAPDGSEVVLKMPLAKDPEVYARMRDEARVGARVAHPNLVETLDLFTEDGTEGGRPVLVVGYVDGVAMQDLRKAGRITTAGVARIGWQMASCLHALHEADDGQGKRFNVIHRDVSGGNILIDTKGDARLIDLGIARFDEGRSAHTATGHVIGTVRYMAPEILDEENHSPASDLWALACVLYEAAAGTAVFPGGTREIVARITRFKSIGDLDTVGLDDELVALLARVLNTDPKERIDAPTLERELRALEEKHGGGAAELARLVERFRGGPPVESSTPRVRPIQTSSSTLPFQSVDADDRTFGQPTSPTINMPRPRKSRAALLASAVGVLTVMGGLLLVLRAPVEGDGELSPMPPPAGIGATAKEPPDAAKNAPLDAPPPCSVRRGARLEGRRWT